MGCHQGHGRDGGGRLRRIQRGDGCHGRRAGPGTVAFSDTVAITDTVTIADTIPVTDTDTVAIADTVTIADAARNCCRVRG